MVGLFGRSKAPLEKKVKERKKELRKLVKQKQYEKALKVGNEILEKNPYDQDILFIVGGIYYMENKLKTAISHFDRSLVHLQLHQDHHLLLQKYEQCFYSNNLHHFSV